MDDNQTRPIIKVIARVLSYELAEDYSGLVCLFILVKLIAVNRRSRRSIQLNTQQCEKFAETSKTRRSTVSKVKIEKVLGQ